MITLHAETSYRRTPAPDSFFLSRVERCNAVVWMLSPHTRPSSITIRVHQACGKESERGESLANKIVLD